MPNIARHTVALAVLTAAIVAAIVALDLPSAAAQSDEEEIEAGSETIVALADAGRIIARRLDDGRTEFGWQPTDARGRAIGARVLPSARYFPVDAQVGRWLNSGPVEVERLAYSSPVIEVVEGRINARLRSDDRIEFAFTLTDGERILTDARYFPAAPRPNRWLRSTPITISAAPAAGFIAVSVNLWHSCAIRAESGAIECWGWNKFGQADAPAGRFSAVSAGHRHTCAIRESGEIACWGSNVELVDTGDANSGAAIDTGKATPPTGSFTAVVAGVTHSCAIRAVSGVIECWGDDRYGLTDAPAGSFTAISANYRSCAIRAVSGVIECWGNDGAWFALPPPAGSFTAVSVGTEYTCGLRVSGAIECWGNTYGGGQAAPAGSFTAVAAGTSDTCAIRESGAIECWGNNAGGQGDAPAGSFTAVSASKHAHHACAIRDTGAIECWGSNEHGQTAPPAP